MLVPLATCFCSMSATCQPTCCRHVGPDISRLFFHFTLVMVMAKVVPFNDEGVREINGWTFYYTGWTSNKFDEATYVHDDATQLDRKPKSSRGCLDVAILKKHGCDLTESAKILSSFINSFFRSAHRTCLTLRMMDECHTSPTLQHAPMFMHQLLEAALGWDTSGEASMHQNW